MKGNFQIIILIIFIVSAILGVLVFSGAIPVGNDGISSSNKIVFWGTIPEAMISNAMKDFNDANPAFTVAYIQKSADTFDQDLLESLALGTGPDIFLLPDNLVFHYTDKIFPIPYDNYSLASFKNNFAGAGEVFLTSKGILAFPISIDPLLLYYNRSILDANGVVYPPVFWSDVANMAPTLTKKDDSGKITKSAIAFGYSSNVTHFKDILATLFMQAGNPIIQEKNEVFNPTLDSLIGNFNLSSILKFYTDFADPNNVAYSWNKSFPNSDEAFSREDLAFYFGYASELQSLVKKNPNQNFFVAPVPQIKDATFKATMARVTGIAISAFSKNIPTAFLVASQMATGDFASKFTVATSIPGARRDLLAVKNQDAFSPVFYGSALFAKSWLDPSPKDTDNIFGGMIDMVISNNMSVANAIKDANTKLSLLLIK